jgi:hypothetical protein
MDTKFIASLILCCTLSLPACKKDEITSPNAPAEIQGTWIGYEVQGGSGAWTLQINGSALNSSGLGEWYKGSVSAKAETNPKEVDFVVSECSVPLYVGKTSLGIYKMSGDTLTVSQNEPGVAARSVSFRVSFDNRVFVFLKQR